MPTDGLESCAVDSSLSNLPWRTRYNRIIKRNVAEDDVIATGLV